MKLALSLMFAWAVLAGCAVTRPDGQVEVTSFDDWMAQVQAQLRPKMPVRDLERIVGAKARVFVWARKTGYVELLLPSGRGLSAYCQSTKSGLIVEKPTRDIFFIERASESSLNTYVRTRLSEDEVLQIAEKYRAERSKGGAISRDNYEIWGPRIDLNGTKWSIHYTHQPNRWPGDHFALDVDDASGEVKFFGGI